MGPSKKMAVLWCIRSQYNHVGYRWEKGTHAATTGTSVSTCTQTHYTAVLNGPANRIIEFYFILFYFINSFRLIIKILWTFSGPF